MTVYLPIEDGDFPVRYVNVYQRVTAGKAHNVDKPQMGHGVHGQTYVTGEDVLHQP